MAWAMLVSGWKYSFIRADALDVLRFDVVDAGDVEEVVFVVVGDQPFHLGRVDAAVGLGHVDHRQVEAGEDVDLHARQGKAAAQDEGQHADHDRIRMPEGENDRVHRHASLEGS